jgi:pimeloyl-ACP methyl ester carboxylesterase
MATVNHRVINTNGINMHIAEQGQGPLVILCHGFPELLTLTDFVVRVCALPLRPQ